MVSGSDLRKEHLSSVMYPILYNLVLVYRIRLRTLLIILKSLNDSHLS